MSEKKYMTIDGIPVQIEGERNILELCRKIGIKMPTFCYHSDLSIYGACRMCMVEDENGKPKKLELPAGWTRLGNPVGTPVTPLSLKWATIFLYERYKLPILVCENGSGVDFSEEKAKEILVEDEISVRNLIQSIHYVSRNFLYCWIEVYEPIISHIENHQLMFSF